jgi:micrococcal nuclease
MKRLLLTLVLLFVVGCNNLDSRDYIDETQSYAPLHSQSKRPIEEGVWEVVRVIDGDTIIVGSSANQHRIRFIGSDTPETVKVNTPVQPFGHEASDFTRRSIYKSGGNVRLAFDGDQVDRYNRTLAMVYLPMPDGSEVWLNELLIREGLAHARLEYRYSEGAKEIFRQAEAEAKSAKRKIWSE